MRLLRGLPDELTIWEVLVRLPPRSLLRCRAWRRATSSRDFLLAHHGHQPSLPIVWGQLVPAGSDFADASYQDFLALDHRTTDAQLQPVARLDQSYSLEAFCDGLLLLSKRGSFVNHIICNPATREHSPLGIPPVFSISGFLGMYLHRPTSEYRLLLERFLWSKGEITCYVFVLGSDQPPRKIQGLDSLSGLHYRISELPALVRDSLHWFPAQDQSERLTLGFNL